MMEDYIEYMGTEEDVEVEEIDEITLRQDEIFDIVWKYLKSRKDLRKLSKKQFAREVFNATTQLTANLLTECDDDEGYFEIIDDESEGISS